VSPAATADQPPPTVAIWHQPSLFHNVSHNLLSPHGGISFNHISIRHQRTACIVHRCGTETCTIKGVSCFIHNSNKYRQNTVFKRTKNVCWRYMHKACKARSETRDGTVVEECGFHCHAETILNASATVTRRPRGYRLRKHHRNKSYKGLVMRPISLPSASRC